jgi:SAM-dependent methyltransferase
MSQSPIDYTGHDLEAMIEAPQYIAWILSQFEPFLGRRAVEVGAGSGNFSSQLIGKLEGELVAAEPSTQMFPLLKRRFADNARVSCEPHFLAELLPRYRGTFDSVLYVNVLEHVVDDLGELALAHQALKPGGYLCVFVPALPFLLSEFDASVGHHRRYTKKHLTGLMREAQFEIVKIRYFDMLGILPWLIFMKLLHWHLTPGRVGLYDRCVVPLMRILERWLPPPVGKNILVVGRRPMV